MTKNILQDPTNTSQRNKITISNFSMIY